jgi:hypothetical protein
VKRYPFKFLDAYTREDGDIFFGRKEEIDSLYEMVFQSDLILVYGASGTGKTSLIQCGLANRFQSHDWLALNVRRGNDLNASLEQALQEAGSSGDGESIDWSDLDHIATSTTVPSESPLIQNLKNTYLRHFKPIYLIFDQFEELYILGDKQEQRQFIQTVRAILNVKQPVKLLISIREEYLGYLREFEKIVPEIMRKKLRVEPMYLDKVVTVIKGVGTLHNSNVRLKAGEEDAIAEGIFEKIRGDEKTLGIQLPYLQVFLDKLYVDITGDEQRQADAVFTLEALQKMGDIGDVLRNFLDEQVQYIARQHQQTPDAIWQVLSPFVTLDGTKEPLTAEQLSQRLALNRHPMEPERLQAVLAELQKRRILRYSEQSQRYEIAHDTLAKQINAKRSDEEIAVLEVQRLVKSQVAMKADVREYFSEKQLLFVEPYLDRLQLAPEEAKWVAESRARLEAQREEEKHREKEETARILEEARREKQRAEEAERLKGLAEQGQKRARIFSTIAGLIALATIGLGVMAQWQRQKAHNAARSARNSLIQSCNSEIARFNGEILTAQRNQNSFRQYGAEDDVILLETRKIDSLRYRIETLQHQIKELEQ